MSKFETNRKAKENKRQSGRQALGNFFYDLAKMTFGATFLVGWVSIFTNDGNITMQLALLLSGSMLTISLAYIGNNIYNN